VRGVRGVQYCLHGCPRDLVYFVAVKRLHLKRSTHVMDEFRSCIEDNLTQHEHAVR
jgi:hypothetical protein